MHKSEKLYFPHIRYYYNKKYVFCKKNAKMYLIKNSSISTSRWLSKWFFTVSSICQKQVDTKIFINVHFKWVEKTYCIHLLLLGRKPPNIFSHFSIAHQKYTLKSPSSSKFTLDYHSTLPRIDHIRRYEKNITWTIRIPIHWKLLKIMIMMVSWKQKIFEEESLFEDIVCYVLFMIVGVSWSM